MRLIPFLLASAAGFRCVQALVPVANTSVVAEQISLMSACAVRLHLKDKVGSQRLTTISSGV